MEKKSKEEIKIVAREILESGDIIANHGTSIANALNIMQTGFNYNRTSYVVQRHKNVVNLCTYGWKENAVGDSANVVISVPKSFFKVMMNMIDESYNEWINKIISQGAQESVLKSLTYFEIFGQSFQLHIPKEFVKGIFVYTDNTNYLTFLNNREEGLEHLNYIENPNYFENLKIEDQKKFVDTIKTKIFGNQESPEMNTTRLKL